MLDASVASACSTAELPYHDNHLYTGLSPGDGSGSTRVCDSQAHGTDVKRVHAGPSAEAYAWQASQLRQLDKQVKTLEKKFDALQRNEVRTEESQVNITKPVEIKLAEMFPVSGASTSLPLRTVLSPGAAPFVPLLNEVTPALVLQKVDLTIGEEWEIDQDYDDTVWDSINNLRENFASKDFESAAMGGVYDVVGAGTLVYCGSVHSRVSVPGLAPPRTARPQKRRTDTKAYPTLALPPALKEALITQDYITMTMLLVDDPTLGKTLEPMFNIFVDSQRSQVAVLTARVNDISDLLKENEGDTSRVATELQQNWSALLQCKAGKQKKRALAIVQSLEQDLEVLGAAVTALRDELGVLKTDLVAQLRVQRVVSQLLPAVIAGDVLQVRELQHELQGLLAEPTMSS